VEVWAEVTGKYGLTIVEKAAMTQDVVANAEIFSNDLRNSGHAAVSGIYFDTEKSQSVLPKLVRQRPDASCARAEPNSVERPLPHAGAPR
jgi:hypothetical protein